MPSRKTAWRRAIKNGFQNLLRNKLLSAATILIVTLIFFVFNLVLALSFASDSVIRQVGEKIDLSAEIQPEVEDYTLQTFLTTLRGRPEIKEVIYISREEALQRFGAKYPNVIAFLENNHLENPLPNAIRIVSADVADNNAILAMLEQPQFSRLINQEKLLKNQEQKGRNERVLEITLFLRSVGWALNALFALVALLILWNSINLTLHAHQKEIAVMQLVGARHSLIRMGFLFEGVFLSVVSLVLSVGLSRLVLGYLTRHLLGVIENESLLVGLNAILLHFEDGLFLTLVWQVVGAGVVGLLASALATQLYLKKQFSFS